MKIRLYEKEKKKKKSEFQISLCAACNVDFESKNYTILTSRCKGPRFPPLACCNALKDFACTYADAINDMTADCTAIVFSYMDLYGGYPPGLLANMCSEGKLGLNCTNVKEEVVEKTQQSNRVNIAATQSTLLMISATLLILLFHWL
jgi:hypothetical protein